MTIKLKLNLSAASGVASSSNTLLPTPVSSGSTVLKITRKGKERAAPSSVDVGSNGVEEHVNVSTGKKGKKAKKERVVEDATPKAPPTPSSPPSTSTPPASAKQSKATPKSRPLSISKSKAKKTKTPSRKQKQTSAIPPHVLSATSTPKGPLTPLPTTEGANGHYLSSSPDPLSGDSPVKIEEEEYDTRDAPGSSQSPMRDDDNPFFSRASADLPTPAESSAVDAQFEASAEPPDEISTPQSRGYTAPPPKRLPKKPIKELIVRIITELRRKDGYALFEDPVDLETFPDYLDIIGGEQNMMDISTMSTKNEDGEYRSMDEFEADLRLLAASAQKFNPEGTLPHREAAKILSIGLKFSERYRPQVRTPTPSPDPDASREDTMFSGREATVGEEGHTWREAIPVDQYIPTEMLSFAPNSLPALAIGWSVTGGKRSHMKKVTRSKEKFFGKWRHWDLDGSRDVAEMEDIAEVWETHRRNNGHPQGNRRVLDWKGLRRDGEWWDWGGLGGSAGLPPLPGTTYPRPPPLRTRTLDATEWGVFPETDVEVAFISARTGESDTMEVLSEHVRPARPRVKKGDWAPPPHFVNIYEDHLGRTPMDWVSDVATGGTLGEAYTRSVMSFLGGAIDGAEQRRRDAGVDGEIKPDVSTNVEDLKKWVKEEYHGGVFHNRIQEVIVHRTPLTRSEHNRLSRESLARVELQRMFHSNIPLELQPLLQNPQDFMHQGTAGKLGVQPALEHVASEQKRVLALQSDDGTSKKRKRLDDSIVPAIKKARAENGDCITIASGASSPLSTAPTSPDGSPPLPAPPVPELTAAQILENNRLELISLIKCYPLSALKKMNIEVVKKYLPMSVWHLMIPPAPKPPAAS